MPYDRDCTSRDLRGQAQYLRDEEINTAPFVPGATLRVDVFAIYPDKRVKVIDITSPNYIKKTLSYKKFAWHYGHAYDTDEYPSFHNANTYANVTMPNAGRVAPPRDVTYPETIVVVLNGNFNIKKCTAFPVNQYGLTNEDWRLSRAEPCDPIHAAQWSQIGHYSWFYTLKFNQKFGLKLKLPACADGAYNQFESSTLAELDWETPEPHVSYLHFTGERQTKDWCHQENVAYVDSANIIISRAEANKIGNSAFMGARPFG
ncbi:polyhedrin [Erinnyis ello cypovirus 2]|nr:polyhedrin [Erinnyis ello cypovirus 2]